MNRRHELQCSTCSSSSSSKIKTVTAGIKAEIDRETADSIVSGSKKNYENNSNTVSNKLTGTTVIAKAVPLQAWSGSEDSRKLRFPDFMTTAQDGGKDVSLTHRPPLPPGNTPVTHFC